MAKRAIKRVSIWCRAGGLELYTIHVYRGKRKNPRTYTVKNDSVKLDKLENVGRYSDEYNISLGSLSVFPIINISRKG